MNTWYRVLRGFVCLFLSFWLSSCTSLEERAREISKNLALRAAQPVLEKVLFAEVPLAPSNRALFPTVDTLSGEPFGPLLESIPKIKVLPSGELRLPVGDYVVPVMTFCMKSVAGSPPGHRYTLAALKGTVADILRDLHARALSKFPSFEVQILSWAIQNGLPSKDWSDKSREIAKAVIPEHLPRLQGSWFDRMQDRWNEVAAKIPGVPQFAQITDQTLDSLGDVGELVRSAMRYRETIIRYGHNYQRLQSLIDTSPLSDERGTSQNTPWSRITPRVYARFITTGSFQHVGRLEIRVLSTSSRTGWLATFVSEAIADDGVTIDPSAMVGDPGSGGIQPLGFGAVGLAGGVAIRNPIVAAAVLGSLIGLSLSNKNWKAIYDALEKGVADLGHDVKDLLDQLGKMTRVEHDELEKGLRDNGILNGANDTTTNANNKTREYTKPGGVPKLQSDFDGLPYDESTDGAGHRIKTAPDGTKYIERTEPSANSAPSIEVQPPDAGRKGGNPTRVKVRYP